MKIKRKTKVAHRLNPVVPTKPASPQGENDEQTEMADCWVCREPDTSNSAKNCIKPCLCKGSMGLVHTECLEKWLTESGKTTCDICNFTYLTVKESRYATVTESVLGWINSMSPMDYIFCKFTIAWGVFFVIATVFFVTLVVAMVAIACKDFVRLQMIWRMMMISAWHQLNFFLTALIVVGSLVVGWSWLGNASRVYYENWLDWECKNNKRIKLFPISPQAELETQTKNPVPKRRKNSRVK